MERFFISGSQRSGTTMLRLALESHAAIQCFDEAVSYDVLIKESGKCTYLNKTDVKPLFLGYKIPRFTEQLTRPLFHDPDYGSFPSFYKGEKVIHIIRDVLDVVSSMMELKVDGGSSWIDRYGRTILSSIISASDCSPIYKMKYADIESQGLPAHLVGALYWEVKNQGLLDLLESGRPVLPIKYENLVTAPREELLRICQFLGAEWSEALLNHPEYPHAELDENGRAIGNTDPRRRIDTNSVGKHRDLMTNAQVSEVRDFVNAISAQMNLLTRQ